jgi:AcrR family transcriptional regulator
MDAALQLVRRHGPDGFTLREAARQAGVASAAPYRHFPSRTALLAALATEGYTRLHAAMLRAAPADVAPVDRLRELGVAYVRFARREAAHFRVMFAPELADRRAFPALEAASRATLTLLLDVVRAGQGAGALREAEPAEVALACWSLAHGLAALALDGQLQGSPLSRRGEPALAEALTRLMYRGLAPGAPRAAPARRRGGR